MNNQIPYFFNNPNDINNNFNNLPNTPNIENEKILYKLNRLEKNIKILENRLSKLESTNNDFFKDDPTDMYMI